MKLDTLLENGIDSISEKISDVENLYLQIAGERLKKIYGKTPEELQEYLYSAEFLEDVRKDTAQVKRLLDRAHKQNVADMSSLYKETIKQAYTEVADVRQS